MIDKSAVLTALSAKSQKMKRIFLSISYLFGFTNPSKSDMICALKIDYFRR